MLLQKDFLLERAFIGVLSQLVPSMAVEVAPQKEERCA
jgi:hypothetical protein